MSKIGVQQPTPCYNLHQYNKSKYVAKKHDKAYTRQENHSKNKKS